MAHVFNIEVGVWSLKEGFEVRILGLYLGFWSLGVGVWDSRVGGLGWRVWGLILEKFNISVPFLPTFPFVPYYLCHFTCTSFT